MKLQIKYIIESIYDTPDTPQQIRLFICQVKSMYEWRNLLHQAVSLKATEELFVQEILELK
jgi:hypothetical protein